MNLAIDREADPIKPRPMSTSLTVDTEDFDVYDIPNEQLITFSFKEFKAVISYAEAISSPVGVAFSYGGHPLLLSVRNESIVGDFVLSTTDDDPGQIKDEPDKKPKAESLRPPSVPRPEPASVNGHPLEQTPLFNHETEEDEPLVSPQRQVPAAHHDRIVPASDGEGQFGDLTTEPLIDESVIPRRNKRGWNLLGDD